MTDRRLILVQDDGKEIECEILFTYSWDKTKKDYVVFKVLETNEVSAATYVPTDGKNGKIEHIETDEEWEMLEELFADYSCQNIEEESGCCGGSCDSCGGCNSCDGECDCDGECNK